MGLQVVFDGRRVGHGKDTNEGAEVALVGDAGRVRDRFTDRLADAEPVLIEVVGKSPEGARPAADEPAEYEATLDMAIAPLPFIDVAESFLAFDGEQAGGDFGREELLEELLGGGDFVVAGGGIDGRVLQQRVGGGSEAKLMLEGRAIGVEQGIKHQLEVLIREDGIVGFGTHVSLLRIRPCTRVRMGSVQRSSGIGEGFVSRNTEDEENLERRRLGQLLCAENCFQGV